MNQKIKAFIENEYHRIGGSSMSDEQKWSAETVLLRLENYVNGELKIVPIPSHTAQCIRYNDHSATEICICGGLE